MVNQRSGNNPDPISDDEETDCDVTIEELEHQLVSSRKRLEDLRKQQQRQNNVPSDLEKDHKSLELARRKQASRAISGVLNNMLNMMDAGNAEAFVYGVILDNGKVLSGSSDGLRAWWKEKVRFDHNGLLALVNYEADNGIPASSISQENSTLSTPDLLDQIQAKTLGSLISALIPHCNPSSRQYPLNKKVSPPWWPNGEEHWWHELGFEKFGKPPYKKPHDLKKVWRICVLTAVIKHMASDTDNVRSIVKNFRTLQSDMTIKDSMLWSFVVHQEEKLYKQLQQSSPCLQPPGNFSDEGTSRVDTRVCIAGFEYDQSVDPIHLVNRNMSNVGVNDGIEGRIVSAQVKEVCSTLLVKKRKASELPLQMPNQELYDQSVNRDVRNSHGNSCTFRKVNESMPNLVGSSSNDKGITGLGIPMPYSKLNMSLLGSRECHIDTTDIDMELSGYGWKSFSDMLACNGSSDTSLVQVWDQLNKHCPGVRMECNNVKHGIRIGENAYKPADNQIHHPIFPTQDSFHSAFQDQINSTNGDYRFSSLAYRPLANSDALPGRHVEKDGAFANSPLAEFLKKYAPTGSR